VFSSPRHENMVDIVGNALDSGRHFNLHQKRNYPYNKIEFFFFRRGRRKGLWRAANNAHRDPVE
jgi:hypothetical protein